MCVEILDKISSLIKDFSRDRDLFYWGRVLTGDYSSIGFAVAGSGRGCQFWPGPAPVEHLKNNIPNNVVRIGVYVTLSESP